MKRIYVNNEELKEAVSIANDELTFFGFLSHIRLFLKELFKDPVNADIDEYLKKYDLNRKTIIDNMCEKGVLNPKKRIISVLDDKTNKEKDKFAISYDVIEKNFERKMKRIYSKLFESNETDFLNEEGAGAMGGGATGTQNIGVSGFDSSGYVAPLGQDNKKNKSDVIKRKIYITTEQAEQLKEATTTTNTGKYEYDAPIQFNGGNDPAYDHSNLMADGWNGGKRIGVRRKRK